MQKRCPKCTSILSENDKDCSQCYHHISAGEAIYSIEDVSSLFVKRKNDKVFGPFPKSKILSLVSNGKLEFSEYLSDDRENWYSVSSIQEFASDMARSSQEKIESNLPALKEINLPGLKMAGSEKISPESHLDLPVSKGESRSAGLDLPVSKGESRSGKDDFPGLKLEFSFGQEDLPMPGSSANLPPLSPVAKDVHRESSETEKPDPQSNTKGVSPINESFKKEKTSESKNLDSAFPLTLEQTAEKLIFNDNTSSDVLGKLSGGLFQGQDGVDLSSLDSSSELVEDKPLSLSLDHSVSRIDLAPVTDPESGGGFTLELSDNLDPSERPHQTRMERTSRKKSSAILLLFPLLAIVVVAVLYFLALPPFSNKQKNTKKDIIPAPAISKNPVTISEHEKNILELNYKNLIEKTKDVTLLGCESALILSWFYHEFEYLDVCIPHKKQPLNAGGTPETRRFQFFRVLNLQMKLKTSLVEKFYDGSPVLEPLRIGEEIIAKSKSEAKKKQIWNFLTGILHWEKRDYAKSLEAFQGIKAMTQSMPFGIMYHLVLLDDEDARKMLAEDSSKSFWHSLMPVLNYYNKNLLSFSWLDFPGEFPRIPIHDILVLEDKGKRFRALNYAFSSLAAWESGQLDIATSLCDKAISEDDTENMVWKLCSGIRVFHGQTGKFSPQLEDNRESLTLLSWLIEGRKNPAVSAWEDLKNKNPEMSHGLAPMILVLTDANPDELAAAIAVGLESDLPATLHYLWVALWQKNDSLETVEKSIMAWKGEKENIPGVIDSFLQWIGIMKAGRDQDWKRLLDLSETMKMKGSAQLELDAMIHLARFMHHRDAKALTWADTQLQKVSPSARGASALLFILGNAGKLPEAHLILDKYQEVFRDPMFYKAASQLFLSGTRKDRLMRARFFVDKALKINPQDSEALFLLGFIQLESGQHESGEKTISQAVMAMQQPVVSWFLKWSELESRLNRPHMALIAMDAGLRKIPDYGPFLFRKAQILATRENPKEALKLLEKTRDASIPEVHRAILEGRCYFSLRQKKEAEAAFAKAVKLDSSNILARFMLGKILLGNGKLKPAIPQLEKVVSELEKAQEQQRIPVEASDWQTYTLESMLTESYRLLGGAYKETGNRSMAIRHVKKYASMVPNGPLKDEALRLLLLLGGE